MFPWPVSRNMITGNTERDYGSSPNYVADRRRVREPAKHRSVRASQPFQAVVDSLFGREQCGEPAEVQGDMNRSAKRIIVACLLTAAMGLMICPPWHGRGHRLLWNGRGTLDWSRLALELCLVASIGALAAVVAPMVGRPSTRALKIWFRRAGLVLGCAAVLTLATTAGYDVIVRIVLLRDYSQEVRGFQAKEQLLQQAFPIEPPGPTIPVAEMEVARQQQPIIAAQIQWDESISNVHEAEIILRNLGCDDRSIQRATTRFLSASTPEYSNKTLMFEIGTTGEKHGDCPPKEDIFDQVAANAAPPSQAPPPPPGFTVDPSELQFVPEYREIGFDFRIEDSDLGVRCRTEPAQWLCAPTAPR